MRSPSPQPADELQALYQELHQLAAGLIHGERPDHTLSPTALVHEAWLRLAGNPVMDLDPAILRRVAARVMRRLLIDHARKRKAAKRSAHVRVHLELDDVADPPPPVDLLALDEALDLLAKSDARACRAVELRVFGGLTLQELASSLDISTSHAKRVFDDAVSRLRHLLDAC